MRLRGLKRDKGAASTEYGIAVALIGVASIAVVSGTGASVADLFWGAKDEISMHGEGQPLSAPPGGVLVNIPGEDPRLEKNCRTDTAGNDNFVDGGEVVGGNPVDTNCYLLTEGGKNKLHPDGNLSRDYYVVAGGEENVLDLQGGVNNAIVWEAGKMIVSLPDAVSTTFYMKGLNKADVDFTTFDSNLYLGANGNLGLIELSAQFNEGPDSPGNVTNLIFDDVSMSEVEIHEYALSVQQTSGDDFIRGTLISETFGPGTGDDVIQPGGGDDTIIYGSGNWTIDGQHGGKGSDTLDLTKYTQSQVTLGRDDLNCTVTTPDGVITLHFMRVFSEGDGGAAAETILFSDGSLNEQSIRAGCVSS